jgi:hypothetical protein
MVNWSANTQSFLDLLNTYSLTTDAHEEFLDSSLPHHRSDVGASP